MTLLRRTGPRSLSGPSVLRGTTENPDTFFQTQEASNSFYLACPQIVQGVMQQFAGRTGRSYNLFDYYGDKTAERVIVLMGSGAQTVIETVEHLAGQGEKVGVLAVRLYRPFSVDHFISALPKTLKALAVLDRTKEAGAVAEPLYLDVFTALRESGNGENAHLADVRLIAGRYGLSSKEFTPGMVKAVFDELRKDNRKIALLSESTTMSRIFLCHMTRHYDIEGGDVVGAVFFGLGSDGTVGANKNSIKIIGEETDNFAQAIMFMIPKVRGGHHLSPAIRAKPSGLPIS